MSLARYRSVLSRPGVPALLVLTVLARMPVAAAPVVLTLHLVLDLHRGFAASGLLGAAFALGGAVGAPLLGRAIERVGLRPVLAVTSVVEGGYLLASPWLDYPTLLVTGAVAGLLGLPVFFLARQSLSAMCPPAERQAGFSLDSMGVELSFAAGPAAAIWLLTATSSTLALGTIGALVVAAGAALFVLDPPVRADDARLPEADRLVLPEAGASAGGVRSWLTVPVATVLLVTFGATLTVAGTDTALTAVMTSFDRVDRLGLVFAVWCLASLVGGFVFGASGRRVAPPAVLALLAVLCLPVALAGSWTALALLVIPTGLFCAPLMSVTAERLTATTPPSARGLVLGLHGSALTVGNAVGAPLTGLVADAVDPRLSFAAIGVAGLVLAGVAVGVQRLARPAQPAPAPGTTSLPAHAPSQAETHEPVGSVAGV